MTMMMTMMMMMIKIIMTKMMTTTMKMVVRMEGFHPSTHLIERFITFFVERIQQPHVHQLLHVLYPSNHVPRTLLVWVHILKGG